MRTKKSLTPDEPHNWTELQEVLRSEEWQIHTECFSTALEGLRRYRENEKDVKLGDIAKLFELGSYLGRLATGLPTDKTPTGPDPAAASAGTSVATEVEAMLNRIYGKPLPGEVVPEQPAPAQPKEGTHANA